jgi:hypothetical protein
MIGTYAFAWSSNSINGEPGGVSLTYSGGVWGWNGRVDFPTDEHPSAHVNMVISMACAGSPKTFTITANFDSATDESAECNPLLLVLGTLETGWQASVDLPDPGFDPAPPYLDLFGCVVSA